MVVGKCTNISFHKLDVHGLYYRYRDIGKVVTLHGPDFTPENVNIPRESTQQFLFQN